jgi:hypothetical protein
MSDPAPPDVVPASAEPVDDSDDDEVIINASALLNLSEAIEQPSTPEPTAEAAEPTLMESASAPQLSDGINFVAGVG